MTIYNDTLETGENVYMIASERSERADLKKNISALKTYDSSLNIYIADKSLFVGTICPCVRNTRDNYGLVHYTD